jgi:hypothetical protein
MCDLPHIVRAQRDPTDCNDNDNRMQARERNGCQLPRAPTGRERTFVAAFLTVSAQVPWSS